MKRFLVIWLLIAAPALAQTPTFINGQRQVSSSLARGNNATVGCDAGDGTLSTYVFCTEDASLAGNTIIAPCTWATTAGVTAAVTDNKSSTYAARFTTPPNDPNQTVQFFVASNVAAGVHSLTLTFTGGTPTFIQCAAYQYQNLFVTGGSCGQTSATFTSTTTVAAGSFTPTGASCLILQIAIQDSSLPSGTWTAMASPAFTLLDVDKRSGFATQMLSPGGSSAINPTLTLSVAASGITAAIAVPNGTTGSSPSGMFVRRSNQNGLIDTVTSYTFQFPCSGNLVVVAFNGNTGETINAVTGTLPTSTYTQISLVTNTEGNQAIWMSPANIVCTQNHTITISGPANIALSDVTFYDLTGAATLSPSDATAGLTDSGNISAFTNPLSAAAPVTLDNDGILVCTIGVATNGTTSFTQTGFQDNQDENNGWGHFHYSSTGTQQTSWGMDQRQAPGGPGAYSDACGAFKSSTATAGGGTSAGKCHSDKSSSSAQQMAGCS